MLGRSEAESVIATHVSLDPDQRGQAIQLLHTGALHGVSSVCTDISVPVQDEREVTQCRGN